MSFAYHAEAAYVAVDGRGRYWPTVLADELADLMEPDMVVRADQPGRVRNEFRTTRRRAQSKMLTVPMIESVLDDAVFLAGIGGERAFLDHIAATLRSPQWALFLGKREYPPTYPILLDVVDGDPADIVRQHDWIAAPWYRRKQPRHTEARLYRPRPERRTTELGYIQIDNPAGRADRIRPSAWIDALDLPNTHGQKLMCRDNKRSLSERTST